MDETHLLTAVRYVTLDSVRARLVAQARDGPWSSARANLEGVDDKVVRVAPVAEQIGKFGRFPDETVDEDAACAALRRRETVGRPVRQRRLVASAR